MKIVTLFDNESNDRKLSTGHGLAIYIETEHNKILFDLGPNNDFIKNAKKLGIDLSLVDTCIISHGHNDHGSGLKKFMKINKYAKIYVSDHIFNEHVKRSDNTQVSDIGIKPPSNTKRLTYIQNNTIINESITIYSEVPYERQVIGDANLMTYKHGRYEEDRFDHEIYLVIQEHDKTVLVTGCSHKGIENIIDTIETQNFLKFTHIYGGFHFSHYDPFNIKQTDYLINLGSKWVKRDTEYYTCHCTGEDAFLELKQKLREKLSKAVAGTQIII